MIGDNPAWDRFLSEHRWAVLTTLRSTGSPVGSVVAYARVEDRLVVSTPGRTFKTASLRADPRASLTAISNEEPFNFVNVEATCRVLEEDLVEDTLAVFRNIEGTGYPPPDDIEAWLEQDGRVILELTPQRIYGVIR